VDIGGVDALLHVGDISWARVSKPSDVLSVGQQIEAKVLKVDRDKNRISIGAKQLLAHPWDSATDKYKVGDRVRRTISRVVDFGAFVELEPGVEGLIHISELSWTRKVKRVSEVVKEGDQVEAVVLSINPADRRIGLGLKQALGDPWTDAQRKYAPGTVVSGPITKIEKFGAFMQVAEGVEGLIHVSEISPERRIDHPRDVLKQGQVVEALVLGVDPEKRQMRLSMKQLVPTGIDEYLAEHKPGDVVTGRIVDVSGATARVELGEGIYAQARITAASAKQESASSGKADLSALTSMLSSKWKSGAAPVKPNEITAGQVRSFKIASLDAKAKKIDLDLA
jgi:small subunit ribosomal protein S1